MRGILHQFSIRYTPLRIIPAHAGNTTMLTVRSGLVMDHPRSCGEYWAGRLAIASDLGSSPLMRGIQFLKFQESQNCRIIPAHAGNTIFFLLTRRESEDHPRSCGEYSCRQAVNSIRQGSSPLMRGIPLPKRYRLLLQRIIPAHAGNTSFRPVCTSRCTDHPRSCGEYSAFSRDKAT